VTDLFSSSKNDTDFFFGTVSAKVSTRLLISFSAVIFSGMIAIFKRNTNYSKKKISKKDTSKQIQLAHNNKKQSHNNSVTSKSIIKICG
jgi:hypothetical protein